MANYEDIVNLALRRSLFYPASEIYSSAPAGMYDYGPYGTAIKRKIVDLWRKHLVQGEGMLEIDGALIMPEDVFKASGHLGKFNDPMTQCAKCNLRHRADALLKEHTGKEFKEAMKVEELTKALREHKIKCPNCKGELMDVKPFNMTVKVGLGAVTKSDCYLRPETCQTLFLDFARMAKTMRMKLPQGLAQAGKAFRNEISPRQTLMRQVEFSQMEAEVFFDPTKINEIERFDEVKNYKVNILLHKGKKVDSITAEELVKKKIVSGKLIAYYLARTQQLYEKYGMPLAKMRFRELGDDERAFYAKEAFDFEVETSLGWMELIANNYRTDYDLKGHAQGSKKELNFTDPNGKKVLPHIWEISIGIDRTFYAVIELAYREEMKKEKRVYLSLPSNLAPVQIGVFPLASNKEPLLKKAKAVQKELERYEVQYDESGSIGKRYARMDEIGCPYGITVDFQTLEDETVTVRERDSTKQERVKISELKGFFEGKF